MSLLRHPAHSIRLAGIFMLLSFLWISEVLAAIKVGPSLIEIPGVRGENYTGTYQVENVGTEKLYITVAPENWLMRFFGLEGSLDVSDWLEVDPKSFELKPGEAKQVDYLIKVPPDLDRERVAQVFFVFSPDPPQPPAPEKREAPRFRVSTRLGAILYLAPKGHEVVRADIVSMNVSRDRVAPGKLKLFFQLVLQNRGNVHIRPAGRVTVLKDGNEVAVARLDRGAGIFAGASVGFYARTAEAVDLADGTYEAGALLDTKTYGIVKTFERKITFRVKDGDLDQDSLAENAGSPRAQRKGDESDA